jgi:site-specific recombinase XerD
MVISDINRERIEMTDQTAIATTTPTIDAAALAALADRVLGLASPSTKRNYARAYRDFGMWLADTGATRIDKATVQAYAAHMKDAGIPASSINQRLSAIRKLAGELADAGTITDQTAAAIRRVEGQPQRGARAGNWLTLAQAQALLNAPDVRTLKGLRDRAILAVLLGCGLRRKECAALTFAHVQQREGRWAIVDMTGKRSKVRTVPMPAWCKAAIDAWADAAGIADGCIFRAVNKGGKLAGESMTDQAVYNVIADHAAAIGMFHHVAAHDTRRTFAKLAMKGGASLEQVSLNLGHDSLATTQRYLGLELDYTNAPGDVIGLTLETARPGTFPRL